MRRGLFALAAVLLTLPLSQADRPAAVAGSPQTAVQPSPAFQAADMIPAAPAASTRRVAPPGAVSSVPPRLIQSPPQHAQPVTAQRAARQDVPASSSAPAVAAAAPSFSVTTADAVRRTQESRPAAARPRLRASHGLQNPTTDQEFLATFRNAGTAAQNNNRTVAVPGAALADGLNRVGGTAYVAEPTVAGRLETASAGREVQLGSVGVQSVALMQHVAPATAPIQADNRYDAVKLHTSITVPAFHHPLNLTVGGGYERLVEPSAANPVQGLDTPPGTDLEAASTASAGSAISPALGQGGHLNVGRAGYVATASVPVNHHLKVGVGYSQSVTQGSDGATQSALVGSTQQQYTGAVTYAPGNGRTSVSLVGRASHAVDSLAPSVDTDERRGDLLFSVKF